MLRTASSTTQRAAAGTAAANATTMATDAAAGAVPTAPRYTCMRCKGEVYLRNRDPVRCVHCDYRILQRAAVDRFPPTQFLAR